MWKNKYVYISYDSIYKCIPIPICIMYIYSYMHVCIFFLDKNSQDTLGTFYVLGIVT